MKEEYILLKSTSCSNISEEISDKMLDGWQLSGTIIIKPDKFNTYYYQPMTRVLDE